jgi:hypothetical protein
MLTTLTLLPLAEQIIAQGIPVAEEIIAGIKTQIDLWTNPTVQPTQAQIDSIDLAHTTAAAALQSAQPGT